MCGIYGIVGDAGKNRLTLARALCVLNVSRGHDSSGIATVGLQLETEIYRKAQAPTRFARSKDFKRLAGAEYRTLIGHTRWATHGAISDDNAHPFKSGSTIGVHNGCVANVKGMSEYTGKTFAVDSQYLIYCLDKFGHIGPAQGSLNLAYFGKKDCADLRLIRFGNPLAFSIVNHGKAFVFSSEASHLRQALSIAGIRGKIQDFPEETAARVCIEQAGIRIEYDNIPCLPDDQAEKYFAPKTSIFRAWDDDVYSVKTSKSKKQTVRSHELTDADFIVSENADEQSWREFCDLEDRLALEDFREGGF